MGFRGAWWLGDGWTVVAGLGPSIALGLYIALGLNIALAQEPDTRSAKVEGRPGHGVTLTTGDDRFEMTLHGRVQVRETLRFGDEVSNELGIHTVRVSWEGYTLSPDLEYTVQLGLGHNDFEDYTASPILDAYVEYTGFSWARLRVGQSFVAFDRARMMREVGLQFVERQQMVEELTLDRDVGLQVYSTEVAGGHLGYHVGVYSGDGRNFMEETSPGFLYVGRFVVKPFGDFETDEEGDLERLSDLRLALGVAGAFNHRAGRIRSSTGPRFAFAEVNCAHFTTDLILKYRGLYVLAEYLYRRGFPRFQNQLADGVLIREWARSGWGYLMQGGYMVAEGLEIVARWNELFALEPTDPELVELAMDEGREISVGLNLYLNGHRFKFQAEYSVRFGRPASDPEHIARAALDASF